jgi:hypothetical protein
MASPLDLPEYLRDLEIELSLNRMVRPEGLEPDGNEPECVDKMNDASGI